MKTTKWLIAVSILALIIISVIPAVLAEDQEGQQDREAAQRDVLEKESVSQQQRMRVNSQEDADDFAVEVRERVRERNQKEEQELTTEEREMGRIIAKEARKRAQERIEEIRKEVRERIDERLSTAEERREYLRRFEEAKKKIKDMNRRYEFLKEHYKKVHHAYVEHRQTIAELRDEAMRCRAETTECREKKMNLKRGVRLHLLKTGDVIERSLEKLINRVTFSKTLTDAEKEKALEELEKLEEELTEKKQHVENLADDASPAELRDAIKELKQTWQEIRKAQRRIIASLINSKLDNLVAKHKEYAIAIQQRITQMQEKGYDTTELEVIAQRFADHIVILEEDYAAVKDAWEQIKEHQNGMETFREAQKQLREDVKKSKAILREFMSAYRTLWEEVNETEEIKEETEANEGIA
jgi:flagellar basal body-associated protein FliL